MLQQMTKPVACTWWQTPLSIKAESIIEFSIMVFPEIVTFAGKGRKNRLSRVKNVIAWEHLTFYSNN